jgi:hypothetical protein
MTQNRKYTIHFSRHATAVRFEFGAANRMAMDAAKRARSRRVRITSDAFVVASYEADGAGNVTAVSDEIGVRLSYCRPADEQG